MDRDYAEEARQYIADVKESGHRFCGILLDEAEDSNIRSITVFYEVPRKEIIIEV